MLCGVTRSRLPPSLQHASSSWPLQGRHNRINRSHQRPTIATMATARVLVLAGASSPELEVLKALPEGAQIVGIGKSLQELERLSDEAWTTANVVLTCGIGPSAPNKADIQGVWARVGTNITWLHSSSAGLEHLLFPELVEGPTVITNAKGVFSHSLAEWALTCCGWFAKDFPRLLAAKEARRWELYHPEELRGKTLGVVGYGDIGQASARLAKAFRMRVLGLRRRTELTEQEKAEGIVEKLYSPEHITDLVAQCDYIIMATPHTPATDKLFSAAAVAAMKPNAVFVNIGRGKCVDEPALIEALQAHRIRGAALDVFATEPLPQDSQLWGLDNVIISAHTADRTKEFQHESLQFFVQNVGRFVAGEPLLNVCDKRAGY